jgi:uncharacterized membrane protein YcjF (UPF0283 family)
MIAFHFIPPLLVVIAIAGAAFPVKEVIMDWLNHEVEQAERARERSG